ncbi:MAG TPA: sensor domain-containing diguanylate cyclase [Candidatus Angelobacter sp.]|nr:sensor domain-containing diguanylate cyclase [Candidatus Angelobacter sp.]
MLESMQKIAILYDASQAVLSTFDLDEVLNQILSIIRDYFQLQNGAVMLLDKSKQELYVQCHFGRSNVDIGFRVPVGQGLTGAAAKLKRPIYAADVSKDSRYIDRVKETKSEVAIPLMVRNEVVGVLDFQSDQIGYFDAGMIDLLTLFSTQASIALENARLYSLERRRAEQLEAINAVARQTTAVLDLDELLTVVCRLILEWFRIDHVAVLLVEGEGLRVRAYEGKLTPNVDMGTHLAPGVGLASQALAQGKSLIENDVNAVKTYVPGFLETQSEMCVPLIFFGEKLGVLALDRASHDAFDQDEIQPLESVADICAAAIQNANYFERMKQLAYVDGLTGIFNRRYFEMRIAEELERASRFMGRMSVIMVDIDHFKRLNDEFGHLLGDEVLRGVSNILKQQLRKVDMVCRYGGEEFAIVVPETTGANTLVVAEKLRRQIETHPFPGVPRPVTISCGVADYPSQGSTRDELVAAADSALYQAKQAGRNRVVAASCRKGNSASK